MNLFLHGVIFTSALVATISFLRFWRKTKDTLFLFFALAFALFGIERILLASFAVQAEYKFYLIRLAAFTLIIIAVVHKNRRRS